MTSFSYHCGSCLSVMNDYRVSPPLW